MPRGSKPRRRRWTEPIPAGARVRKMRGQDVARWRDDRGRAQSAPVVTPDRGLYKGQRRIQREAETYTGEYRDGDTNRVRRVVLGRDHEVAAARLKELLSIAERERAGLALPAERRQQEAIDGHVDEFERVLSTMGRHRRSRRRVRRPVSGSYQRQTLAQIRAVVKHCRFAALEDIRPEPIIQYVESLKVQPPGRQRGSRAKGSALEAACPRPRPVELKPLGPKTRNTYLDAVHGFTHWAVESGLLPVDRLANLPMYDESEDVRRKRRALEPEQAVALIEAATHRPERAAKWFTELAGHELSAQDRQRIGVEHALWWKWLILTGIRAGEAAGLKWADVDLDAAHVFVSAKLSKNRKDDYVALRSDLVADLRRWRELCGNPPAERALFALPTNTLRVFKRDLKAAGVDFRDADGRQIDVHALRTTCATWLSRVALKAVVAQHLRHGKSGVTEEHYVKLGLRDTREAVEALPALPIPGLHEVVSDELKATGTDDAAAHSANGQKDPNSVYRNTVPHTVPPDPPKMSRNGQPTSGSDSSDPAQIAENPEKTSAFRGLRLARPQRDSNPRRQDENLIS